MELTQIVTSLELKKEPRSRKYKHITIEEITLEGEEWKDVDGYEGLYSVSTFGRVFSHGRYGTRNRILKPSKANPNRQKDDYYHALVLHKNNKSQMFKVHRLVAIHFIPNPKGYRDVNHLDGKKNNNHVSNLEWCDSRMNLLHAYRMGLRKLPKGEANSKAKLTAREVSFIRYIVSLYPNVAPIKIAKFFGVTNTAINDILNFKRWKVIE